MSHIYQSKYHAKSTAQPLSEKPLGEVFQVVMGAIAIDRA
jgi:hypothetical protein